MSIVTISAVQPTSPVRSDDIRVAFSSNSSRRHITERYLSDTFAPGCATHFDLDLFSPDVSVLTLLEEARRRNETPAAFAHVVDTPAIPRDLEISPIPTASLDIDSFWWTSSRIRWSMLFDYVFVWHPSLSRLYKQAGHPNVVVLPHAVDEHLFRLSPNGANRRLDLGWVGGFGYAQYATRRRVVETLAARFKMNEFERRYSKEETVEIYKQSRIVVNVSREDFPPEANMRCYEAMAGGALLITRIPTELTEWGFCEGEHFVGWRNEGEIPDLVDHYLRHEQIRAEIARRGQELTLRDFTYQKCRDTMISLLCARKDQFFAPARNWAAADVRLIYLEYYYRYQIFERAFPEFRNLRNLAAYCKGLPMILKTWRHQLKRRLRPGH